MREYLIFLIFIAFYVLFVTYGVTQKAPQSASDQKVLASDEVQIKTPPKSFSLPQSHFVAQSFNNCGPASLSMVLSMFGKNVSQDTLRDQMRPFNNPYGGVDDKSIFADEFVTYAEKYGMEAVSRPNGTPELMKKFIANGIPVVVRTWLSDTEEMGHFRILRGYDENKKVFIQDDSYQGPGLRYTFDSFLALWKPFNYGYIVIYPKDKKALVDAILGSESDEKIAYKNSISRAENELKACHPEQSEGSQDSSATPQNDRSCAYSQFNLATANYYLGNYQKSAAAYEASEPVLPFRMLWYQPEPIYSYLKLKNYDRVFSLTDLVLYNGNLAYSELYQVRGEADLAFGNKDAAKQEFESAVYYNKNYLPAQEALKTLN